MNSETNQIQNTQSISDFPKLFMKKLVSLILIAAACLSVFAGCGNKAGKTVTIEVQAAASCTT